MAHSGNTTADPESTQTGGVVEEVSSLAPALTLVWSADEPHRAGEVTFFPDDGRTFLGREDAALDQATFVRVRPGGNERTGPLHGSTLSRKQLQIDVTGDTVAIDNVGRLDMLVNGVENKHAVLTPGDVITLHKHSVLLFSLRPARLPRLRTDYPAFTFGEADRFGFVGEAAAT